MSSQRIRSDDFDIESGKRYGGRDRRRSRSRSRVRKHAFRNESRSRSRSMECRRRKHERYGRESYSGSRSRSRSHSRSRGYNRSGYSKHRDRRHQYNKDRSRDRSRSRSRSHSYSQSCTYSSSKHRRSIDDRRRRSNSRNSSQYGDEERHNRHRYKVSQGKNGSNSAESRSQKCSAVYTKNNLNELPLSDRYNENSSSNNSDCSYGHARGRSYYDFHSDEPIDKERIHREIEERLRETLAREGKVYPPPKTEASHPVFANDGSFLEVFKKMQEQQKQQQSTTSAVATAVVPATVVPVLAVANPTTAPYLAATAMGKSAPPPPIVGRRRGGKILKTGVVAKPKVLNETTSDPKDFWALYLAEVNKYKNTACESEAGDDDEMKLETAPFDPRFPNTNQTRYCYQSYIDYHRCQKKRGESYEPCNYFKKVFTSMCPNSWVEKWNEQIENGNFAGRI